MIPIIVIAEGKGSFNYFEGEIYSDDKHGYKILHTVSGDPDTPLIVFGTSDRQLRDKVLELLHEEASELCYENTIGCIIPACFQIYLKDIIEKAKGVTPNA